MKILHRWLQEYIDIDLTPQELASRLTMAGNETEGMQIIGDNWNGIIIGEITDISPHPNADRLRLVTLDLGGSKITVVCGAPNVKRKAKIAFAPVGARLTDPQSGKQFQLKPAKIRGVTSEGMTCSEKELGISDNHEGILLLPEEAPVGKPLADYMGDIVYDLAITPNRPDCLSIIGIAREVSALTKKELHLRDDSYAEEGGPVEECISVDIIDPELCPRYCASLVTGVKIAESPWWLKQRLIKCGMRPINNIVDITNYVMLEHGQPLHAFDYDELEGSKIIVRRAQAGERITSLDGLERSLSPDMLVIADQEKAVAIAGVMGGMDSEVTEGTTSILLEAANFEPASIHHTGRTLRMPSEACMRFERGIRPELIPGALKKATKMILELAGGVAAKGIIDVYPGKKEQRQIILTPDRINKILGVTFDTDEVVSALKSLGFTCEVQASPPGVLARAPFWRSDIKQDVDLIEEVARIVGYESIPTRLLSTTIPSQRPEPLVSLKKRIRDHLTGYGFQEIVSYSLTGMDTLKKALTDDLLNPSPLKMANPMTAEQEYLRTYLRPNLINTLFANLRHSEGAIKIFELGKVYIPRKNELPYEPEVLCALLSGPRQEKSWHGDESRMDFYDAKGVAEGLLNGLVANLSFEKGTDNGLHPGKQAAVVTEGYPIGVIGEIHPKVLSAFDIQQPVFLLEIDVTALLPLVSIHRRFSPIPRFPAIVRDIALIVDRGINNRSIEEIMRSFPLVEKVDIFDVYSGSQVPGGKKSLAYRITFRSPDHTLTDQEVDRVQKQIMQKLDRECGATLRS